MRPHIKCQSLTYLKNHDISITKDPSREKMFRFFDIIQIQSENESGTVKIILDKKKISKSIIETDIQNIPQLRIP